jgi:hypothetical protein
MKAKREKFKVLCLAVFFMAAFWGRARFGADRHFHLPGEIDGRRRSGRRQLRYAV